MKKIRGGGIKFETWELFQQLKAKSSKHQDEDIIKQLLKNRGITGGDIDKFVAPKDPLDFNIRNLGLRKTKIDRVIKRLKEAKRNKEKIIIYGDYDTDGICGTAILWEVIYSLGYDVIPYIPERFSEGYGLNADSVTNLKSKNKNLKLIITVDNGITAGSAVKTAKKLGIDVVITDHHLKPKQLPEAYTIIHTEKICGSSVAWILAREIVKKFKATTYKIQIEKQLELAAIGTIADQMPLVGINRSFAKYGIQKLNTTFRVGLLALFNLSGIKKGTIGTYEINYVIAPRLNAMGRIAHAIDSLRLLCTRDITRAGDLARKLNQTNQDRQKIVDDVMLHAKSTVKRNGYGKVIILADESYHEGVIGLAAGKLAEEFYRPSIVLAKGKIISKASARSIPGFNIIAAIKSLNNLISDGGGHPMAAGFTIKSKNINKFIREFKRSTGNVLTDKILSRKLRIDTEIYFDELSLNLLKKLKVFEPVGLGNPQPLFVTNKVMVVDMRSVGQDGKHLKLKLENNGKILNAIAFNFNEFSGNISPDKIVDVVYNLSENTWNGNTSLDLVIKDFRINE